MRICPVIITHAPGSPPFERRSRKTYWVYAKRLCLRDIGEVTLVLSKTGRNVSPGNTKLLVTNLPDVTARQVRMAVPIPVEYRAHQ